MPIISVVVGLGIRDAILPRPPAGLIDASEVFREAIDLWIRRRK
jgi:hypothetical protein